VCVAWGAAETANTHPRAAVQIKADQAVCIESERAGANCTAGPGQVLTSNAAGDSCGCISGAGELLGLRRIADQHCDLLANVATSPKSWGYC